MKMKHIILSILILLSFCGYGQNTESQNLTLINIVRNQTLSPARVANALDALNYSKQGILQAFTAAGTDTYTVTGPAAISAYADGQIVIVTFTNANTGAATLNINSIGAAALKDNEGTALSAGALVAGGTYMFKHNGTNFWMVGASGSSVGGTGTVESVTGDGVDNSDPDNPVLSFPTPAEIGAQETLVSGTNIKTVNGNSIVGSGDVDLIDDAIVNGEAKAPSQNATFAALALKQDALVSGTSLKTVNSTSLLGSGNVAVQDVLVSGTNIKTINSTSLLGSGDIAISATPAGSDTYVQYNSSGSLGAEAAFNYNASTNTLDVDVVTVDTEAYDATGWNSDNGAPTKDATRDKIETLAPLASPTFTGTPAAPTATAGTSTTQVATTAFVQSAVLPAYIINANASPYSCVPDNSGYDNALRIEQAIEAAYQYAAANNRVAYVEFDPGEYYITRALVHTSNAGVAKYNCQVPLPWKAYSTTAGTTAVVIRGKPSATNHTPAIGAVWGNVNNGVTFRSNLTGQSYDNTYGWPSVFGGPDAQQGSTYPTNYSFCSIEFQNVTFKVPEAPTLACVNDMLIHRITYDNIQALIHRSNTAAETPQPTSALGIFNFGPNYNNNVITYKGSNFFYGLYAGPSIPEHTVHYGQIAISDCAVGFRIPLFVGNDAPFHGVQLQHITTEGVAYGFAATDKNGLAITSGANGTFGSSSGQYELFVNFWDMEVNTSTTWAPTMLYYIYDLGDIMTGHVNYVRARHSIGAIDYTNYTYQLQRIGARRVTFNDLSVPPKADRPDPMNILSDNFIRVANTTSMGNCQYPPTLPWIPQAGTWGIIGEKAYCVSAVASGATTVNRNIADCGAADYNYNVSFTRAGTNSIIDIIYRYVDANNYWVVEVTGSDLRLYKKVASVVTQVGSTYTATFTTGKLYEVKIITSGTSHTVYLNQVSVTGGTSSDLQTATYVGFGVISGSGFSGNGDRFYRANVVSATNYYNWNADKNFNTIRDVTATYSVVDSDYLLNCNGTFTTTFMTAVARRGKQFIIKNTGAGTITIATTSSQTIDGASPGTVAAGATLRLMSDGANWITW
jgi:hypothetical protein